MNDIFINETVWETVWGTVWFGWAAALAALLLAAYLTGYFLLRCWGKLRVNAEGWHASGIFFRRFVVWSALGLLGWYQPLLRLESAVAGQASRLFGTGGGKRPAGETPVSEVVVELVRFS